MTMVVVRPPTDLVCGWFLGIGGMSVGEEVVDD